MHMPFAIFSLFLLHILSCFVTPISATSRQLFATQFFTLLKPGIFAAFAAKKIAISETLFTEAIDAVAASIPPFSFDDAANVCEKFVLFLHTKLQNIDYLALFNSDTFLQYPTLDAQNGYRNVCVTFCRLLLRYAYATFWDEFWAHFQTGAFAAGCHVTADASATKKTINGMSIERFCVILAIFALVFGLCCVCGTTIYNAHTQRKKKREKKEQWKKFFEQNKHCATEFF